MKKQNLFPILHLLTPSDRVYIQIALRHFPDGVYNPATNVLDPDPHPPLPLHAIPLVDRLLALKCIDGWLDWSNGDLLSGNLQKLRTKLAGFWDERES